jgi:DNA-binding transcriptional MerR regulator
LTFPQRECVRSEHGCRRSPAQHGQFARASGLTAKALRHYDAVGLLTPALVEPASGYRRYRADQVARAKLIRRLRGLDLPIVEVRRLLGLYAARSRRDDRCAGVAPAPSGVPDRSHATADA